MNKRSPIIELTITRLRLYYREPGALFWSFGFPILVSLALGIAFRNRPPDPTTVAVVNVSDAAAPYAALAREPNVKASLVDETTAATQLRLGQADLVVVPGATLTYRFDPMRPESRLARLVVDGVLQRAAGRSDPYAIIENQTSEPGGRYIDFLIPGLIGINIMSSGMWGIGYGIVETRTKKLLKRMLATPMRRSHFLLSFLFMRLVFVFIELPVLLGFAWLAFDVRVRGSIILLTSIAVLGALAFSGLGILVAARAKNLATINGLINAVIMPMFILSGVFFSASHFPTVMQPFIRALPLTALNDGMRAVMNEGAGLLAIAPQAAVLTVTTVVTFVLGLKLFRWN